MHCGKAGAFGSVHGTLTHLQGEQVSWLRFWQIEKWMWHVFKRQDGRVVGAGCLELEVKDTSCSGWEVRKQEAQLMPRDPRDAC